MTKVTTHEVGFGVIPPIIPMDTITKIKKSLEQFLDEVNQEKWYGKERELINRFVFNHLINMVEINSDFYSPAQIAIESRVKQIKSITGRNKKEVCKDLVIWQKPNQTVWADGANPLLIMEWKFGNGGLYSDDIEWLEKFTRDNQSTTGIAINIDIDEVYSIKAALIYQGKIIDKSWINTN